MQVCLGLSRALECFFWITAFLILVSPTHRFLAAARAILPVSHFFPSQGYNFLYLSIGWSPSPLGTPPMYIYLCRWMDR